MKSALSSKRSLKNQLLFYFKERLFVPNTISYIPMSNCNVEIIFLLEVFTSKAGSFADVKILKWSMMKYKNIIFFQVQAYREKFA